MGTWFNPWMEFSEEELGQCDFLLPVCRGPVFAETYADYNQTQKWLDAAPTIETVQGFKVRLLKRVCVKDRKLKPNVIAGVLQWTPDFIRPIEIVEILKQSQLKGFSAREVDNRKAQLPFHDFHLLYSDHLMPAATRVVTPRGVFRLESDLRMCSRTRVSSRRVRDIYREHKLKGWIFEPVLEKGSELYAKRSLLWNRFIDAIRVNRANHV